MPWYLRKLLGPYMDEATDGADGGDGGAANTTQQDGQQPPADGGTKTPEPGTQTPQQIGEGMLAEIEKGLTPKNEDGTPKVIVDDAGRARDPKTGNFVKKPGEGEETPPADKTKQAPQPKLGPDGKPIVEGQPPAKKKADDFKLSAEEQKTLAPKSVNRFHEIHRAFKETEAELERERGVNAQLIEARDNITSVLEQTHTSSEDLAQLLEFNMLVKTGNLEKALAVVETQRTNILKLLGKEAPGYDPLEEHPDLKQRVDGMTLSRDDALEIVKARRAQASVQQRDQQQRQTREQAEAQQRTEQAALNDIKRWEQSIVTSDVDYARKKDKLSAQIESVIRDYRPEQWLPTLKMLYEHIQVEKPQPKPAPAGPGTGTPIRPTGARGGAAQPTTMVDAISQGLGYQPGA